MNNSNGHAATLLPCVAGCNSPSTTWSALCVRCEIDADNKRRAFLGLPKRGATSVEAAMRALRLRVQQAASTDPDYLERMAQHTERAGA